MEKLSTASIDVQSASTELESPYQTLAGEVGSARLSQLREYIGSGKSGTDQSGNAVLSRQWKVGDIDYETISFNNFEDSTNMAVKWDASYRVKQGYQDTSLKVTGTEWNSNASSTSDVRIDSPDGATSNFVAPGYLEGMISDVNASDELKAHAAKLAQEHVASRLENLLPDFETGEKRFRRIAKSVGNIITNAATKLGKRFNDLLEKPDKLLDKMDVKVGRISGIAEDAFDQSLNDVTTEYSNDREEAEIRAAANSPEEAAVVIAEERIFKQSNQESSGGPEQKLKPETKMERIAQKAGRLAARGLFYYAKHTKKGEWE